MRTIYKKELKTYLSNVLTYITIALLLLLNLVLFVTEVFDISTYTNIIYYESPIYSIVKWMISLIPVIMFLTYVTQRNKRVDTQLYASIIPSFKIVLAKILAVSTIFIIPLLIILVVNILLILTIFTSSAMVLSIYILAILLILVSASFSTFIYILFKSPIISLIISVVLQGFSMMFFTSVSFYESKLFLPYLQGLLPIGATLIFVILAIIYTLSSILLLNKKRNIK